MVWSRPDGCRVRPAPRVSGPRPALRDARRVVVKVGSALVVDEKDAAPREAWLASVAADLAAAGLPEVRGVSYYPEVEQ